MAAAAPSISTSSATASIIAKQHNGATAAAPTKPVKQRQPSTPKTTTTLRKGFLLGGGPSPTAIIRPTKQSSGSFVAGSTGPTSSAELSRLDAMSGEVQAAMHSAMPAMQQKLADGAWMTPALLQRVMDNPVLRAGMANPRLTSALEETQRNPGRSPAGVEVCASRTGSVHSCVQQGTQPRRQK